MTLQESGSLATIKEAAKDEPWINTLSELRSSHIPNTVPMQKRNSSLSKGIKTDTRRQMGEARPDPLHVLPTESLELDTACVAYRQS
jgi:hypothetical protein